MEAIARHDKRVRFYSTVDLVNPARTGKTGGRAGRLAHHLLKLDLVVLDEFGYLPLEQRWSVSTRANSWCALNRCRSED